MLVQSNLQHGQQTPMEQTVVAPLNLAPGSRWKNFIVEKRIGAGGFGVVYRALDTVLNRPVALKFVTTQDALREGKLLAKVKDQGVVAVHSIEEDSSATAICMEFVRGVDLEHYLASHGHRLHPMHAAMIGRSLCRSLAAVHRMKLLHRDIKPRNVIVSDDDRFVLVDFGLGTHLGAADFDSAGTLHYMAPERLERNPATPSSDIYALGVLLFYLVSGEYPVAALSAEDVLNALRTGRRQHLADYVQVPPTLESIIERAISPDPETRFRSAGAMLTALDEFIRDRPTPLLAGKWVAPTAVAIAGLAMLTLAAYKQFGGQHNVAPRRLDAAFGVYQDLSLSDDGRILVYSSDKAKHGDLDVWIEDTKTGLSRALTSSPADEFESSVSPDGMLVAYRSERPDKPGVYVKSPFGDEERLVAPDGRHPRFSPDARTLAYWTGEEGNLQRGGAKTYIVPLGGGAPVQILPEFADCRFPVWSPDGSYLLVTATKETMVAPQTGMDWWLVRLNNPREARKLNFFPQFVKQMRLRLEEYPAHWAGSDIVFSAHGEDTGNIWRSRIYFHRWLTRPIAITGQVPHATDAWNLKDGTIAWSTADSDTNLWTRDLKSPESQARRLTHWIDMVLAPRVSRDGHFVLFNRLAGSRYSTMLWDTSHADPEALPDFPPRSIAILSPDPQHVIYSSSDVGPKPMFEYFLESKTKRTICDRCGAPVDFLAGGHRILFTDGRYLNLWDEDLQRALPLIQQAGRNVIDASVSPSADRIAFVSQIVDQTNKPRAQIYIARVKGTSVENPARWTEITSGNSWSDKPRWSPDGSTLYYYDDSDGHGCVYAQPLTGMSKEGIGKPVQHFHEPGFSTSDLSDYGFNFYVSAGKIYFNIVNRSSSLWLQSPKSF
jgi:serine/threonine protein kinase